MDLKKWLILYSEDVLSGAIVANEKHKWACIRFLRDVEREGTEEFPYIFDEDKAMRFMDWMRLFKHRKGVLQGQYIEPAPIQYFVFGNIYGWIHRNTQLRRFRKGYWGVSRKSAKSQSLSCVGSYESSAFGEQAAEVYCAATKKDQAKIVWNETDKMIAGCENLKDKFKTSKGEIVHLKSDSIIKPLSKEDQKTGDGLNPQCGIIDEYHAHKTSEIYDIIDSGMGARPQPLLMIITTAGFELDYPCYRVEYRYVSDILNPESPVENDAYFVMINELDKDDDIKDEKNWIKANPILCSYEEGVIYLRQQLQTALDVPEKMRNFLTKNMNIWVDAKENGYMPLSKWKDCEASEERKIPEDLTKYPCYVGVDLSQTTDLTSLGFVFKLDDGKYFVRQHSFIPEERLRERMKTDHVPYDLWIKQGWLTATPGAVVDYNFVEQHIMNQREKGFRIVEIDYDKWNASHFAQNMELEGFEVVEVPQSIKYLVEPTKGFRSSVYKQEVLHENDPLLTWAIGNAVTKDDAQENIMLDKSKSTNRIDPIAAVINGFYRAMNRPKKESVYKTRGAFVL